MVKISQSHVLNSRQSKSLKELVALDGTWCASSTAVGSFLERYIAAEAVARRLITLKTSKPCPHSLNFTSIQSAVRFFNYSVKISPSLVEAIFRGGVARAGEVNTPRQLRNLLIHGLSAKAAREVELEHKKLMDLMQKWLAIF